VVISSPDVSKELCDDESRVGTIKKPSLRLFISSLLIITRWMHVKMARMVSRQSVSHPSIDQRRVVGL
jgi:hypothetical protein